MSKPLELTVSEGIATITLNRPEAHNTLNAAITSQLLETLHELKINSSVRVVVLTARGKSFCAGVDLNWINTAATSQQQNDCSPGMQLALLMHTLYHFNKPTIALIAGRVYGGGSGLPACCDIVIASPKAYFCFSEVRLGLIPAVISPYVVRAIGSRTALRYLLTAESFSVQQACEMGLVHEVLEDDQIQQYVYGLCQKIIAAGPAALSRTKQLIHEVDHCQLDHAIKIKTANWLTEVADSPEAREGISAFLQKRSAKWINTQKSHEFQQD